MTVRNTQQTKSSLQTHKKAHEANKSFRFSLGGNIALATFGSLSLFGSLYGYTRYENCCPRAMKLYFLVISPTSWWFRSVNEKL